MSVAGKRGRLSIAPTARGDLPDRTWHPGFAGNEINHSDRTMDKKCHSRSDSLNAPMALVIGAQEALLFGPTASARCAAGRKPDTGEPNEVVVPRNLSLLRVIGLRQGGEVGDSRQKLSPVTVTLHWIISSVVIGMLVIGFYMAATRTRSLWDVHKSVGILIFLVIMVRVLWRIRIGWPQAVGVYQPFERNLARFVHWTLIVCSLLMPISGMVSSVAGGNDLSVFGLELIADNPDPAGKLRVLPHSSFVHDFVQNIHAVGGWVFAVAITLHLAGALKHHFVDRDGTLRRMLGATVD